MNGTANIPPLRQPTSGVSKLKPSQQRQYHPQQQIRPLPSSSEQFPFSVQCPSALARSVRLFLCEGFPPSASSPASQYELGVLVKPQTDGTKLVVPILEFDISSLEEDVEVHVNFYRKQGDAPLIQPPATWRHPPAHSSAQLRQKQQRHPRYDDDHPPGLIETCVADMTAEPAAVRSSHGSRVYSSPFESHKDITKLASSELYSRDGLLYGEEEEEEESEGCEEGGGGEEGEKEPVFLPAKLEPSFSRPKRGRFSTSAAVDDGVNNAANEHHETYQSAQKRPRSLKYQQASNQDQQPDGVGVGESHQNQSSSSSTPTPPQTVTAKGARIKCTQEDCTRSANVVCANTRCKVHCRDYQYYNPAKAYRCSVSGHTGILPPTHKERILCCVDGCKKAINRACSSAACAAHCIEFQKTNKSTGCRILKHKLQPNEKGGECGDVSRE